MKSDFLNKINSSFKGRVTLNKELANLSWFNVGGKASIFFKAEDLTDLLNFRKEMKNFNFEIKTIGAGSNLLIRDGGFKGAIIKLGKNFSNFSLTKDNMIIAGTAALDKKLSQFALKNSLAGFEFLSCIPGSIGGGIYMNSGCYDSDISQILLSVQAVDLNGRLVTIPRSEIKFYYRGSNLDSNLILVSATFQGVKKKRDEIEKKIQNFVLKKKNSQPSRIKTCGSTFKNPVDQTKKKAWELIQQSKCQNMFSGDACISEEHSNFFVNKGNCKSKDLEKLILDVKNQVLKETGVRLELELQIIGEQE